MEPWSKSSKESHPSFEDQQPSINCSPHLSNENEQMNQDDDNCSIISISNFDHHINKRQFEHKKEFMMTMCGRPGAFVGAALIR
jgi:hypothetical protein